LIKVAQLPLC